VNDYKALMLGRVLGGIATSVLFSSFETWMVCEHHARGFKDGPLKDTFSRMYFGNSLCAIAAGIAAEYVSGIHSLTKATGTWYYGGYCAPFDLSACCLVIGLILTTALWRENYGGSSETDLPCKDIQTPIRQMSEDVSIPLTGIVISLFEGSMYIFVFNWTPMISSSTSGTPPFGLIFSIFMVACMGGSQLFAVATHYTSSHRLLIFVLITSSVALVTPLLTNSLAWTLSACLLFEACVGTYWPAIGTIRSKVVPEETRATIYNIFRVPLNGFVIGVLLSNFSVNKALAVCSALLFAAFFCQRWLASRLESDAPPFENTDLLSATKKNSKKETRPFGVSDHID